ncbi:hydantoinase/carbamoylase family amidase [Mesorhizobium sp. M2A.F.Ca.ET.037.01.1.1]|uniref:Zn-dependent hydrolase n=1 Tax=unclassified Mesorhizobium TaxID=325217 RepID=UPI000F751B01|nr:MULTISPECIES: Zn-dependent hydrolase [unclassified Mesorhizobium]RVC59473.1 hydantoinase/carbamoylase family amidase [Mesorhizobium sp. M00.F.Ca.ET.038.03.1.1]AZO37882.1 Zn-dependent hydrolase [Mesorhizobium sp. M2A.F.Ca.ET.046.03.2.1]RUX15928.1 hydantoinase/carbamoylase family amidase [Mesorhizobium sp. M2A.F.Ca.ET.037.01.1.1]RWA93840.1 MAG: hydantoinase/carbamoylase family amidase [Mesorhizobium sp.]RWB48442.1 MAG: hydantoinase/carbamoylase family amidase [Mesorhizobium sp.]
MNSAILTAGGHLAGRILETLAEATTDAPGITRIAYGPGERFAHNLVREEAQKLGAVARTDAAGNLYLTLSGRDPDLPALVVGSHLDSVAHGGNFDGAAGVVAGLAVMAELVAKAVQLPRDLIVLATRAEEAVWFPLSYPGSQAALGLLDPEALEAKRSDSGRTLAEHMREEGFDPDAVRRGVPGIYAARIAAFVEVHIEQGPRLVAAGAPVGIVTGIAGGFRYVDAKCLGAYAHSGAEPRFARHDAVLGFADLVAALEIEWDALEREDHEATITFGRVQSDPTQHGGSRVLGELGFTLDVRSAEATVLERVEARLRTILAEVSARRGVAFELGQRFTWEPATMSADLAAKLDRAATELQMRAPHVPSGAGHDAATFAGAGIPTAMVFVRNENGSHNPHEAMEIADLDEAIRLLFRFVTDFDNPLDQP